jgi:hypothetical protein
VTELPRSRGGRSFRATIRRKGNEVHLGLYETPWLAAFAFNVASESIGRGARPPNDIPLRGGPTPEEVRSITTRVRRRLGLDRREASRLGPPSLESLLTFFEITVVGFWRGQAAIDVGDAPGRSLDAAAGRIVEAAGLLFWDRERDGIAPEEAMTDLLAGRIDSEFRRKDLSREILEDDGDDPWRVARWLAFPDLSPGGRGFREEVRHLYAEMFDDEDATMGWADVLGLRPPFDMEDVRTAYRIRSKQSHPDAGGSPGEFVRLNAAYESARAFFRSRGGVP